jgi:hypothetical protein
MHNYILLLLTVHIAERIFILRSYFCRLVAHDLDVFIINYLKKIAFIKMILL